MVLQEAPAKDGVQDHVEIIDENVESDTMQTQDLASSPVINTETGDMKIDEWNT